MTRVILIFLMALSGPAAATEICDDLWFTRNRIIDLAGYCFGSNLGKATFDNTNCVGKSVNLGSAEQRDVASIQSLEKELQCKVNTRGSRLRIDDLAFRMQLRQLPVPDEFESGCLGWQEGPVALRAGRTQQDVIVGEIRAGDYLVFGHIPVGLWNYVTVWTPDFGRLKSAGWLGQKTVQSTCVGWAG